MELKYLYIGTINISLPELSNVAALGKICRSEARRPRGFIPSSRPAIPIWKPTAELSSNWRAPATVDSNSGAVSAIDGRRPVIQRASERALRQGFGLTGIATIAEARKQTRVPIVLFSYFNPLLQFGLESCARSRTRGVDRDSRHRTGPEEAGRFAAMFGAA